MKENVSPNLRIADDVKLGKDVKIYAFVNLYGCEIGDNTRVGTFVEVQKGAKIGANCKISSHTFICEGVTIEDNVFIGHGVTFINDMYPRSTTADGLPQTEADWKCVPTLIRKGASIGSGATILAGITIGENGLVGAGSVVTKDVPPNTIVAGNPARVIRRIRMNVPFLDLKAQYAAIKQEINPAIQEVLDSCAFAGGPFVEKFEKEWAAYCGVKHAVAVGNGTDALWLALLALGIGRGDEVITVPNTFLATTEAINLVGATPVLVDVDPHTYTMDPALLEGAITGRTKAIIPVHLFGQTADMDPILAIAKKRSLTVIEDACQAHGAEYRGKRAGSLAAAGCFSFYPGKNLGAYGEAGAVTTDRQDVADIIRKIRDHGQKKKYYHDIVGINGRMDGVQGAILSVKLKHLDAWTEGRRKVARGYTALLADGGTITLPVEALSSKHVYHVFSVRVKNRDAVMEKLEARSIHCGIHYPVPIHLQQAYKDLNLKRGSFPVAEACADEFLSLPMFPELSEAQISYVAQNIRDVADGKALKS